MRKGDILQRGSKKRSPVQACKKKWWGPRPWKKKPTGRLERSGNCFSGQGKKKKSKEIVSTQNRGGRGK